MTRRSILRALLLAPFAPLAGKLASLLPSPAYEFRALSCPISISSGISAQQYAALRKLMQNAIDTHDQLIEDALFACPSDPARPNVL